MVENNVLFSNSAILFVANIANFTIPRSFDLIVKILPTKNVGISSWKLFTI